MLTWTITEKQRWYRFVDKWIHVLCFLFAFIGYSDKKSNEIIDGGKNFLLQLEV